MSRLSRVLGVLAPFALTLPVLGQVSVFVDATSPNPTPPYSSWFTAAHTLQSAIDVSPNFSSDVRILVAQGSYAPTTAAWNPAGPPTQQWHRTIRLKSPGSLAGKLGLHGGFLGYNSGQPSSIDWSTPDGSFLRTIITKPVTEPFNNLMVADSSLGDFNGIFEIDGFMFRDGNRALRVVGAEDGLVENIRFRENGYSSYTSTTALNGGAMNVTNGDGAEGDFLRVRFCNFERNVAPEGGAIHVARLAGGMALANCEFRENGGANTRRGGAIYLQGGDLLGLDIDRFSASNCVFHRNEAGRDDPGALDPLATGCGGAVFMNAATAYSPGVFLESLHQWRHCTFADNSALNAGGAMYTWQGLTLETVVRELFVENSIFNGNSYPELAVNPGGFPGNAMTVTVANNHFTRQVHSFVSSNALLTFTGDTYGNARFISYARGDLRLAPDSPCIDTGSILGIGGDPCDVNDNGLHGEQLPLDLDLNPRVVDNPLVAPPGGTIVDRGAYERRL